MEPIEQAWYHYGGSVQGRGFEDVNQKARCPLHDDKHASAVVHLNTGKWRCYAGCGFGDIYDLIQKAEKIDSFSEAKRIAVERFGVSDGAPYIGPVWQHNKRKKERRIWRPSWL